MTRDEFRVRRTLAAIGRVEAFSPKILCAVYGKDAGRTCFYCGRNGVAMTRDHVMPKALGGQTVVANIVPACKRCNHAKYSQHPSKWFQKHPRFASQFLRLATHASPDLIALASQHAKGSADDAAIRKDVGAEKQDRRRETHVVCTAAATTEAPHRSTGDGSALPAHDTALANIVPRVPAGIPRGEIRDE